MNRENPASVFIAQTLAEHRTGNSWSDLSQRSKRTWMQTSSHLIVAMYDAGFTIPQPADAAKVWDEIEGKR